MINKKSKIVQVMKPQQPTGILWYMDFKYENKLEIRLKKIKKIINGIK